MKISINAILYTVALISFGLLGGAFYLQHGLHMLPCPLCIIQRYLFLLVAIFALVSTQLSCSLKKIGIGLTTLIAIVGVGVASWHLWVQAYPDVSCGIDPLEVILNKIFLAQWFPKFFEADGLCSAVHSLFGLSIVQWSFVWFVILGISLVYLNVKQWRK